MVKPSGHDRDDGTERKIFEAADRVFARRGTDGARMQEIAEEAGVNKALLHYYYRTKDQLAQAVFQQTLGKFLPTVVDVMASERSIEEKVRLVVDGYLDQLSRRPYIPGYVISEITHHPDRLPKLFDAIAGNHIKQRVLVTLRRQIDEGVREGKLAPIEPEQFLINVVSLCVFPFAARPMLMVILGQDGASFERFIEQRRHELPRFIMKALRP